MLDEVRRCDQNLKQGSWASNFARNRFKHCLRQIDASSWLILNDYVLTRLPLSDISSTLASDYVDKAEGFIYRICPLQDQDERPETSMQPPEAGSVCLDPFGSNISRFVFNVGSTGCIKFRQYSDDTSPREHENLAFATIKKPARFLIPKVLWYTEVNEDYVIFTEQNRPPFSSLPDEKRPPLQQLRAGVMDAVAEMASWEDPKISSMSGVNNKAYTTEVYQIMPPNRKIWDCDSPAALYMYFDNIGFDMSRLVFLNGQFRINDIGFDEDSGLVVFNNWAGCMFVPSGYVMPYGTQIGLYLVGACQPDDAYHYMDDPPLPDLRVTQIALDLQARGLPNEMCSYEKLLFDEIEMHRQVQDKALSPGAGGIQVSIRSIAYKSKTDQD